MNKQRYTAIRYRPGHLWFRVWGYGLLVKDVRRHYLMFSQRNGNRRGRTFGRIYIEVIAP